MHIFDDLFLLQRIDHLVRTRATGTPAQLASRLNTSERKVYRLLGALREQGFPISYDKQADTYYYIEPVTLNFSIMVGSEKLLAIRGGLGNLDNNSIVQNFDRFGLNSIKNYCFANLFKI